MAAKKKKKAGRSGSARQQPAVKPVAARASGARDAGSARGSGEGGATPWAFPWRWAFGIAGVLALGVGALFGADRVEAAARARLTGPTALAIEWPTTRGPDGARVDLIDPYYQDLLRQEALVLLGESADPLSAAPLERLGAHLSESGWFDGTPRVERAGRQTIRVSGQWRRAAAVVRHMGRDYLVDWSGRVMPATYDAGTTGYRFVRGAGREPPRREDGSIDRVTAWADAGVIEGLKLIGVLAGEPYFDQVAGVDVSDFFFDSRLTIVTDRGTEVVWGGPVGEFVPGEVGVEQKLARLREIAATRDWRGRLDAGQDRLEIFDERMVYIDASKR